MIHTFFVKVSLLISILNYKPCHVSYFPFEEGCPIRKSDHIRPTHCMLLLPYAQMWSVNCLSRWELACFSFTMQVSTMCGNASCTIILNFGQHCTHTWCPSNASRNIIHIHNDIMWDWQYSSRYSLIYPHSVWMWEISGKVSWNIVSPTKHCYGFESCYAKLWGPIKTNTKHIFQML